MTKWAAAAAQAKAQAGVISREQLTTHGLTRAAIGSMLRRGNIERVLRGVYRFTQTAADDRHKVVGALLLLPAESALSHFSALREWNLRGVDIPQPGIHLSVQDRSTHYLGAGIVVHRPTARFRVFARNGVPVTGLAQTFVDVARHVAPDTLEAWVDAAQKRYSRFPVWLRAELSKTPSRYDSGVAFLKQLLTTRTGAPAESPMETRTFQYLRRHGLPLPVKQHSISDHRGFICFADFAWPEFLVCAQFDSTTWHSLGPRFHLDAAQRSRLAAAGWLCLTVTSKMLEDETWREELPRILERHRPQGSLFVMTFPHGDRPRNLRTRTQP